MVEIEKNTSLCAESCQMARYLQTPAMVDHNIRSSRRDATPEAENRQPNMHPQKRKDKTSDLPMHNSIHQPYLDTDSAFLSS